VRAVINNLSSSRKSDAVQTTMAAAAKGAGQPARGPKLAELFLKTHERQPQPLSGSQAQFVETHFEVEDASACRSLRSRQRARTMLG
jgi:hypothetical protein